MHPPDDGPAVLERNSCMVRDRGEELGLVRREGRVAIADELPDLSAFPAQREPDRVRTGSALRPRDLAVLEHERRAGRGDRGHGRLHDRAQRLLEVQRLGDRLGYLRQRLELSHSLLGVLVQLRVLDRLCDLARNGHQEVDLGLVELTGPLGAHVQRPSSRSLARIGTARMDWYCSSRRFGKLLKRGSRWASFGIITGTRSAAAAPVMPSRAHLRNPGHLVHPCSA